MLNKALSTLCNKFNQYLSSKFNLEERKVVLASPGISDSISDGLNKNCLIISLVNIERDLSMGINFKRQPIENIQYSSERPSLHLNLHVLVSVNFEDKNYDESLKYLSAALEMVQTTDLLTVYNTPEMSPDISRLHLELENLTFSELSNMWSILGGSYLPSFLLKVRMLTIDNKEIESVQRQSENIELHI